MDLTEENNPVEIMQHPMKVENQTTEHRNTNSATQNGLVSKMDSTRDSHQISNVEQQVDPIHLSVDTKMTSNSNVEEEDETTPRPDLTRRSSKSLDKGTDSVTQELPRQRSVETLRRRRSRKFSVGDMIYSSTENISLPPVAPLQPRPKARSPAPSSSFYGISSEAGPSASVTTRPHRSDTAPPMPISRDFHYHRREPMNFVKSTPHAHTNIYGNNNSHALSYTPEGSLYNNHTLMLPGFNHSQLSPDDEFTLLSSGERSPLPSSSMFDDMLDSFDR